jgi:hypothetical protein
MSMVDRPTLDASPRFPLHQSWSLLHKGATEAHSWALTGAIVTRADASDGHLFFYVTPWQVDDGVMVSRHPSPRTPATAFLADHHAFGMTVRKYQTRRRVFRATQRLASSDANADPVACAP